MRLLNTKARLPGGWGYEERDEAGVLLHEWKGNYEPWVLFLGQVQNFRLLNKRPRHSIEDVEADVTEFLAKRFSGNPKYFIGQPGSKKNYAYHALPNRPKGCKACGKRKKSV